MNAPWISIYPMVMVATEMKQEHGQNHVGLLVCPDDPAYILNTPPDLMNLRPLILSVPEY
jgi:hypothetical protein